MMRFQTAYSTPPVVKNLIILNGLFFLAEIVLPGRMGDWLIERLGLFFWESGNFQIYQLVTSMFLHANFMHLFMNMFALWMFGRTLEYGDGDRRRTAAIGRDLDRGEFAAFGRRRRDGESV